MFFFPSAGVACVPPLRLRVQTCPVPSAILSSGRPAHHRDGRRYVVRQSTANSKLIGGGATKLYLCSSDTFHRMLLYGQVRRYLVPPSLNLNPVVSGHQADRPPPPAAGEITKREFTDPQFLGITVIERGQARLEVAANLASPAPNECKKSLPPPLACAQFILSPPVTDCA